MRIFTWRLFIAYIELLLAFSLVLSAPAPGRCQSSTNYNIHAHVLDSGGGTCRSGSHKMVFSLGQTNAEYIVESGSQNIFTGFIMSRNGLAESDGASDSDDESGSDDAAESGSSSGGGGCFISTLLKNRP
ncbi:hypothetical protein [Desulfocicer niacini]